jgi:hypothetical protein
MKRVSNGWMDYGGDFCIYRMDRVVAGRTYSYGLMVHTYELTVGRDAVAKKLWAMRAKFAAHIARQEAMKAARSPARPWWQIGATNDY